MARRPHDVDHPQLVHEPEGRSSALGETFTSVVERRFARRSFLKGAGAAGALLVAAPATLAPREAGATGRGDPGRRVRFEPIEPSTADAVVVPRTTSRT